MRLSIVFIQRAVSLSSDWMEIAEAEQKHILKRGRVVCVTCKQISQI